jgi:hypothetical protein
MNIQKVLEDLIVDLANGIDVSLLSNKLQVFSRLLGNDNLTNWINQEYIYGYPEEADIPEYRQLRAAHLIASYTTPTMICTRVPVPIINQGVDTYEKAMRLNLRDSISLIAQAINISKDNIKYSVNPHTLCIVQRIIGYAQITESYLEYSKQDFQRVIEISKAKLIDMLMDIDERLFNCEVDFDRIDIQERQSIINNIYATNVHLGNGNIEANNSNNIGGHATVYSLPQDIKEKIQYIIDEINKIKVEDEADKNDIAEEIFAIKEELHKESPSKTLLKRSLRALKTIGSIAQEKVIEHGIDQLLNSLPI